MTQGRSLQLYFIDGRPDGMLTAELFNWTGHVLQFPRTRLKEALARKEAGFTGVYLLIGETETGPLAYIGESENLAERMRNHAAAKDWWNSATLITTAADSLHKAHVKYLEARLVALAKKTRNLPLENGNLPGGASLSEADEANMAAFLDNLMLVLPAIRVDLFVDKAQPAIPAEDVAPPEVPRFELIRPKAGVAARAELRAGEIVVQAGSIAREDWVGKGSWDSGYRALRDRLIARGVLQIGLNHAEFTEDFAFSSPSAAAAVILGRASNGREEWHVAGSQTTYGQWEEAQVQTTESAP